MRHRKPNRCRNNNIFISKDRKITIKKTRNRKRKKFVRNFFPNVHPIQGGRVTQGRLLMCVGALAQERAYGEVLGAMRKR